jgi:hypothetical protein
VESGREVATVGGHELEIEGAILDPKGDRIIF